MLSSVCVAVSGDTCRTHGVCYKQNQNVREPISSLHQGSLKATVSIASAQVHRQKLHAVHKLRQTYTCVLSARERWCCLKLGSSPCFLKWPGLSVQHVIARALGSGITASHIYRLQETNRWSLLYIYKMFASCKSAVDFSIYSSTTYATTSQMTVE